MCLHRVRGKVRGSGSGRGQGRRAKSAELNDDSRHAPRTRYTMSAAATKRAEEVRNKREQEKRTQGSQKSRKRNKGDTREKEARNCNC